jgi:argininosuccinate lyase
MSVLQTSKNPGSEKKLFEFTHGIDVDRHLCTQEIQVQKSWAKALSKIQSHTPVLTQLQCDQVCSALDEALKLMTNDQFHWRIEDEDIHMNLERFLVEKLGELGKKVHFGRSRNDLIATTLRLFVRDSLSEIKDSTSRLILALTQKANEWKDHIIPGMTHLQHAQPVRISHILLGHGWALNRDQRRLTEVQKQAMLAMPLGSAALTGTTLPIHLSDLATELGFDSPPLNSYDAVGDRDFLLDALYAISVLGVHLSRLSEDLIYWSSTPVGLIQLPKNWSTGSSIMPNKRNPDVPELVRSKSTHWIAGVVNGLTLIKGLPSGYNSDLHELKSILIRNWIEAKKCLEVFKQFILEMEIDSKRAKSLLSQGHLLATDLANQLAQSGMPFREAYQKTANWTELAESRGVSVETILGEVGEEFEFSPLSMELAVESRKSPGGTSLQRVKSASDTLRETVLKSLET